MNINDVTWPGSLPDHSLCVSLRSFSTGKCRRICPPTQAQAALGRSLRPLKRYRPLPSKTAVISFGLGVRGGSMQHSRGLVVCPELKEAMTARHRPGRHPYANPVILYVICDRRESLLLLEELPRSGRCRRHCVPDRCDINTCNGTRITCPRRPRNPLRLEQVSPVSMLSRDQPTTCWLTRISRFASGTGRSESFSDTALPPDLARPPLRPVNHLLARPRLFCSKHHGM